VTITGALKSRIDKLWEEFWTGGITNPLTVIEQISFLMFVRMLDVNETRQEKRLARTGKDFDRTFSARQQHLRWSQVRNLEARKMLEVMRDEVFPHLRTLGGGKDSSGVANFLADAQLLVAKPALLVSAVQMIEELPLTEGDAKGDLYEYLLSKLTTAGINGQFRTPRHVIRFLCDVVDPQPTEVIGDPACGTAGFLVGALQYLQEKHTSPEAVIVQDDGSKLYPGDKLEHHRKHIARSLHGFDFDQTMLRIASMKSFVELHPKLAAGAFDVILANPPFKGSLDEGDVEKRLLETVKTKKTELLFLALILRMLRRGGRCAAIVPDGVLFGSSKAHVGLRKELVERHGLEAVFSLPSGVFKPYAGVSTAVLVFTKAGKTEHTFFYDLEADGFSLDDKRQRVRENDLPDALARWQARDARKDVDRTAKWFMVPKADIVAKGYDLSVNRYRETKHAEVTHAHPREILARMKALEAEIAKGIEELEGLV